VPRPADLLPFLAFMAIKQSRKMVQLVEKIDCSVYIATGNGDFKWRPKFGFGRVLFYA